LFHAWYGVRIEGVKGSNPLSSTFTPVFLGVVNPDLLRRDPLDPGLPLVGDTAQTEISGLTPLEQLNPAECDVAIGSNGLHRSESRRRCYNGHPAFSTLLQLRQLDPIR
jgi:hypothetical protein